MFDYIKLTVVYSFYFNKIYITYLIHNILLNGQTFLVEFRYFIDKTVVEILTLYFSKSKKSCSCSIKRWKFSKKFKGNTRFWASARRNNQLKNIQSIKKPSLVFYYSVATLFRISSIFFMWPMVFWSIWNVFVPRTQVSWYSFALRPSFSRERYYSKPLIGLNALLIKVSDDAKLSFLWIQRWKFR